MSFEWYLDFVDLSYKPKDELICIFKVKPADMSIEEVAGRIASESSVGTWTTLAKLPERIKSLMAKAFEIDGNVVKIAYPLDLFEEGNVPQLLSSIAGNVYGMRAINSLRLEDVLFPERYLEYFKGPIFGIDGVRKKLKIKERPITATVPKPKVGYDAEEYAEIAYQAFLGGIDLLKDDENLTSQPFIRFEKRLERVVKVMEKAEKETGERKGYLVNVTAETKEMEKRIKLVADSGNEFVMVDVLTIGFSSLQTVREICEDLKMAIHAHRAMHGALTRNPEHGISLKVLTKLVRMVGVDHMHVGTGVGKMAGSSSEVRELIGICKNKMGKFKPVFPVSSGGLHPALVPDIISLFGNDVIIQAGGGVHGHPDGTKAGAKALRDAIKAVTSGVGLENFESVELKKALEKWGYIRPK